MTRVRLFGGEYIETSIFTWSYDRTPFEIGKPLWTAPVLAEGLYYLSKFNPDAFIYEVQPLPVESGYINYYNPLTRKREYIKTDYKIPQVNFDSNKILGNMFIPIRRVRAIPKYNHRLCKYTVTIHDWEDNHDKQQ